MDCPWRPFAPTTGRFDLIHKTITVYLYSPLHLQRFFHYAQGERNPIELTELLGMCTSHAFFEECAAVLVA